MAADTELKRTRHTGLFGNQDDEAELAEEIDFKMVTFSLAGKEYGIDIMMVAEIAKFDGFTYVPNTPAYVSGVYNLRGDIISIIDMRRIFGLPVPEKVDGQPYDGLILRLESGLIGVVVDSIDKVVGISSEHIQEPHPIFADVNIKYISGVVEHEDELYIILDADRVLGSGSAADSFRARVSSQSSRVGSSPQPDTRGDQQNDTSESSASPSQAADQTPASDGRTNRQQAIANVSDTLQAVSGFYVTDFNREWVAARAKQWAEQHGGRLDLSTAEECDDFLSDFFTPQTRRLWNPAELDEARTLFGGRQTPQVWHPGCYEGYETYALACVLRSLYPEQRVRLFASDNDLLRVSAATSLRFDRTSVPEFYHEFTVDGVGASSFSDEIARLIVFEFSDLAHVNTVPASSIVLIRDVLSFMPEAEQQRIVSMIEDQIQRPGLVLTGRHEELSKIVSCRAVATGSFRAWEFE